MRDPKKEDKNTTQDETYLKKIDEAVDLTLKEYREDLLALGNE